MFASASAASAANQANEDEFSDSPMELVGGKATPPKGKRAPRKPPKYERFVRPMALRFKQQAQSCIVTSVMLCKTCQACFPHTPKPVCFLTTCLANCAFKT